MRTEKYYFHAHFSQILTKFHLVFQLKTVSLVRFTHPQLIYPIHHQSDYLAPSKAKS